MEENEKTECIEGASTVRICWFTDRARLYNYSRCRIHISL